jgi:imidazolonepropionase-like amidohydrolase
LEKAGIPPLHVLQMGTVDIGKNADLVLLDANPIEAYKIFMVLTL